MPVITWWIWDAIIARAEWAAAGAAVAYAVSGTPDADKSKTVPASAEPRPPIARPASDNSREMYIAADSDHQCYADAWLKGPNGKEVKESFLLDTGAAGKVILNREQAAALGFDRLSFDYRIATANGTGKAAKVQLPQFRMGGSVNGYKLANVETWVDYNGMGNPLIGAEILKTLNFQIREGSCAVTLPYSAAVGSAASEERPSSPAAQCSESGLSKMRGDLALHLCEGECSSVAWCVSLRKPASIDEKRRREDEQAMRAWSSSSSVPSGYVPGERSDMQRLIDAAR
jgi:clan AA aspartic protease (TIGR02281 family)